MPLPTTIKSLVLWDNYIKWIPYMQAEYEICSKFTLGEWNKIVADFNTEKEWKCFLSDCENYVQCYMLYRCKDNTPIAFSYYLQEDEKGVVVSIHGGAWKREEKDTLLYYRGFIILIQALLNTKIKVRTACLKDNKVAERFIRSVGFVQYKETSTSFLFWINKYRLKRSRIYRYIFLRKSL